jgi:hypothetical protein
MKMLVLKEMSEDISGEWIDSEVWGATLRLKVRPHNEGFNEKTRKKHKKMKKSFGSDFAVYDNDKIQRELDDYYLEDFEVLTQKCDDRGNPVGDPEPLAVTIDNKIKVLNMKVPIGEPTIRQIVYEKAAELGVSKKETDEGNSDGSPAGTAPESQ